LRGEEFSAPREPDRLSIRCAYNRVWRFGRTVWFCWARSCSRHPQTPLQEVVIRTHPYTPPSAILRAESNLVEVEVTVRDANGRTVAGLRASDFKVLDNGSSQTIRSFSESRAGAKPDAAPPEPKFVIFFFDDLHAGVPGPNGGFNLPFVKQAARAFAMKYLQPANRVSIVTTSGVGSLDFTGSAERFAEAADRLNWHGRLFYNSLDEYQAESVSTLSELAAAAKRLSQMPGTRILVFMSAGFIMRIGWEHGVQPEVDKLIDEALRWNVTVHAIDSKGLYPLRTSRSNRPLLEIAQGTGGHLFENDNNLAGSMESAANPEVTYRLAFNPGSRDGKFHTLKVGFASKRSGTVEFRPGYLSRTDDDPEEKKLAARSAMDYAVLSKEALHDVPAAVSLSGGSPKDGVVPVSIGVTLDVNRLQFATWHGRHMQQLVFLMTLLDSNGSFVTSKESIMELALTDEKLASLRKQGLKTVATLDAPPGIYQVRTVIREGMKGGLAASTMAVQLRAK
jgi:VWFA-related protein